MLDGTRQLAEDGAECLCEAVLAVLAGSDRPMGPAEWAAVTASVGPWGPRRDAVSHGFWAAWTKRRLIQRRCRVPLCAATGHWTFWLEVLTCIGLAVIIGERAGPRSRDETSLTGCAPT